MSGVVREGHFEGASEFSSFRRVAEVKTCIAMIEAIFNLYGGGLFSLSDAPVNAGIACCNGFKESPALRAECSIAWTAVKVPLIKRAKMVNFKYFMILIEIP